MTTGVSPSSIILKASSSTSFAKNTGSVTTALLRFLKSDENVLIGRVQLSKTTNFLQSSCKALIISCATSGMNSSMITFSTNGLTNVVNNLDRNESLPISFVSLTASSETSLLRHHQKHHYYGIIRNIITTASSETSLL